MVKAMNVMPKMRRMLVKILLMTNGAKPVPRITFLAKDTFEGTGSTSFT
jgi:hypothetical protein